MNTHFKYIYSAAFLALALMGTSCNDILDKEPDNRTHIDSPEKVKQLMTGAYPASSPITILELFGDNLVDNNVEVPGTHLPPYYEYLEEAYKWEDIVTYGSSTNDTPYKIWNAYYGGIAVCNQALQSIDEMLRKDPSLEPKLNAYKGEALVLRGFLHFWLVNIFAENYQNDEMSAGVLGVPYCYEVEDVDIRTYERQSVKEVYDLIEKDILEGLPLIDDSFYDLRPYHMNKNAAYAFASRFYLFKRDWKKCEEYASKVLEPTPGAMVRNWSTLDVSTNDLAKEWLNEKADNTNLLLFSAYSTFRRYIQSGRFAYNGSRDGGTNSGKSQYMNCPAAIVYGINGPNWTSYSPWFDASMGCMYISGEQKYGIWSFMMDEYFEYTDKIAGIGYVHMITHPLTADLTLLERAEARFYQGNIDGCIADLDLWEKSHLVTKDLTLADIEKFYTASNHKPWVNDIHVAEMGWKAEDVATATANKPLLDCILHFRRCETLYEGHRWFDIKRYGITISHRWLGPHEDRSSHTADRWDDAQACHVDSLTWNDPRRAVQIPYNVINAGLTSTDRIPLLGDGTSRDQSYKVSADKGGKFQR